MAEYIERSDLEFPYMTMSMWGLNQKTCHAYNEGVKAAEDYIASIPAADVAPVVRCKDCKHFLEKGGVLEPWCDWHEASLFDGDGFCSEGERKDGDG